MFKFAFKKSLFLLTITTTLSAFAEENPTIHLESQFIGDKDQPAVSHFLKWHGSQSADSLRLGVERNPSDNTLRTADRKVMQRQMDIYKNMKLEQEK